MRKLNILILGIGGNVSQGILKAITHSKLECRIVGACVSIESTGLYFCDVAYISPYAEDKAFMPWLIDICNKEDIDIVLTGVEENIIKIAENIEEFNKGTKAIFKCTEYEKLILGQDKLKTNIWLKENNFNYPKFAINGDIKQIDCLVSEVGWPLIAKPVKGKGSKGLLKINNYEELKDMLSLEGYIIQECIGTDDDEYTVGCYRDKNGHVMEPIIMHRQLMHGTTIKAEVVQNEEIRREAMKICETFKPIGPLNIQLRLDKNNRPVCFELNVRFSGTTPMRAHFGFNDVESMIKEYVVGEELDEKFNIQKGVAYRYMNEIYLFDDVQSKLKTEGKIANMKEYDVIIETSGR